MATITEKVKEVVVGTEEEPQLSAVTRNSFFKHAIKDEENGQYYLTEKEFVDTIAPDGEDYVSTFLFCYMCGISGKRAAQHSTA
jgi:solute carrier family 25 aspartate/glutamate transporter 12/13